MEYVKRRTEGVVTRVYKYKLRVREAQEKELNEQLVTQCHVYNRALERRIQAWDKDKTHVSKGDLKKEFITADRKTNPYLQKASRGISAATIDRLDLAYKAFFRRVKSGESAAGFPKFKAFRDWNCLDYDAYNHGCKLEGDRLILANIGSIKVHLYRPLPDDSSIRRVSVVRQADGWFVCLTLEIPFEPPVNHNTAALGIDMGIRRYLTDSRGNSVFPPRFLDASHERLQDIQRELSRKTKGSKRRRACALLLAKQHLKVANRRQEWHREQAKLLVLGYGTICREKLEIQAMVKRPAPIESEIAGEFLPNGAKVKSGLNSKILDVAWGQFNRALDSVAQRYSTQILECDAPYTTQICSVCHQMASPMIDVLKTRTFQCVRCGNEMDLHWNAAVNILNECISQKDEAERIRNMEAVLEVVLAAA